MEQHVFYKSKTDTEPRYYTGSFQEAVDKLALHASLTIRKIIKVSSDVNQIVCFEQKTGDSVVYYSRCVRKD